MTRTDFSTGSQEWFAAWNAHDLERILAHYTEDVELVSPLVTELTGESECSLQGKAALRDYFARGLQAYPTLHFEFIRLYSGAHSCVLEYRSVNGRRAAELLEFNREGKIRRTLAHYLEDPGGGLDGGG
jgi:ketosteroid isomerase-like protein